MYRFEHRVPLDLTMYPDPGPAADDRTGPPLSQGLIMTLVNTVASEYLDEATIDAIDSLDPDGWYHGQILETVLNELEDQSPELPGDIGKNIYYTLRSQFVAMGLKAPADVITTMPNLWRFVTRGDSGDWRTELRGPGAARIELDQPYNCRFEEGAIQGALEAFDARDVRVAHPQCRRDGAPFCVLDITWTENT
jgi:hypothetical protein